MGNRVYNKDIFQPGNKFKFHDINYTVEEIRNNGYVNMTNGAGGYITTLLNMLNSGSPDHKALYIKSNKKYNKRNTKIKIKIRTINV